MSEKRWRSEAKAVPGELLSLQAISAEVERIARRLGGPPSMRPDFGCSRDDGTPHIEVDSGYHYVSCERGREIKRQTTGDLDMLLYWIASDMARSIALTMEAGMRRPHEDSRRQWFRIWHDRLASVDEAWAARADREIAAILEAHPFVDP